MKKNLYAEAVETVRKSKNGHGRDVAWHLLNGTDAYKSIFYELIKLIEKNDDYGFWVHKQKLSKSTKLPYAAMQYPLYKFEKDNLLTVNKTIIQINQEQLVNWETLCGIIRSAKPKT
jgi:hypothetical protein